jgi:hypothetical protein
MPFAHSGLARWWVLGALLAASAITVLLMPDDDVPLSAQQQRMRGAEAMPPDSRAKQAPTETRGAPVARGLPPDIAKDPFGARDWGNGTLPESAQPPPPE